MIKISPDPIDTNAVLSSVSHPNCGASVLFVGSTRAYTDGQLTQSLEYECYELMALHKLAELVEEARRRWPIERCSIVHRVGIVDVGQASIAIAVSSAHRAEAFAAGQWLIDTIKTQVPIWKKELGIDGRDQWLHPVTERVSE